MRAIDFPRRQWLLPAIILVTVLMVVGTVTVTSIPQTSFPDAGQIAKKIMTGDPAQLTGQYLPDTYASLAPSAAAHHVAEDPQLSVERSQAKPESGAANPAEAGLADLLASTTGSSDWRTVADVYKGIDADRAAWLAVTFPGVIGNLYGAPYRDRISANHIRLAAAVSDSTQWSSPPRPWTQQPREPRRDLLAALESDQQLIYLDTDANDGQGAWVELHGDLATASRVGVLVPGGSAFMVSENFSRYSQRAQSFVDASSGDVAMLVWAGAAFPSGWLQEADPSWAQDAAPALVDFLRDLRARTDDEVAITLAGHSYGGGIVGIAETYDIDVDQVMYVASAGAGYGVESTQDYTQPCRPRYAMLAAGDPIGYVQNIPAFTGMGHGKAPAELEGTKVLETGYLPASPQARDDVNRTLGSQGIAGKKIGGLHAHSEVFIPYSDAWTNMLKVFKLGIPILRGEQPPKLTGCKLRARAHRPCRQPVEGNARCVTDTAA